jgi:hypothetical protein
MQTKKPATAERPSMPTPNSTISLRRVKYLPPTPKVESKSYLNQQIISGNILHQTKKSVKIITSSVSQNPALAFVDIKLSSPDNIRDESKYIKIKALYDSGCAKTLTAFYSEAHGKQYCFTRCPQGLKNFPLHLKLLLDKLLGDIPQDVIHYADDFMVATDGTLEDHLKKVGQVLDRLKKGNIKIRPQKISVAKPTVDFLSVVWQKGKLSKPEERLLAFTELPSPNMPKKTKGIVAMIRYCQKFIPHYAHPAKPLGNLAMAHPKTIQGDQQT